MKTKCKINCYKNVLQQVEAKSQITWVLCPMACTAFKESETTKAYQKYMQ